MRQPPEARCSSRVSVDQGPQAKPGGDKAWSPTPCVPGPFPSSLVLSSPESPDHTHLTPLLQRQMKTIYRAHTACLPLASED